jgi:hypothetical protein
LALSGALWEAETWSAEGGQYLLVRPNPTRSGNALLCGKRSWVMKSNCLMNWEKNKMPKLTPEEIEKRKSDRKKEEFWSGLKRLLVMALFSSLRNKREQGQRRR